MKKSAVHPASAVSKLIERANRMSRRSTISVSCPSRLRQVSQNQTFLIWTTLNLDIWKRNTCCLLFNFYYIGVFSSSPVNTVLLSWKKHGNTPCSLFYPLGKCEPLINQWPPVQFCFLSASNKWLREVKIFRAHFRHLIKAVSSRQTGLLLWPLSANWDDVMH